jgi:hypothetical protein
MNIEQYLLSLATNAKRYALIDAEGKVYNVVMWDGETQLIGMSEVQYVQTDTANIGDTYADGVFTPPPPPDLPGMRPAGEKS